MRNRSNKFQVSLSFLLQQAAWLYERHFAQMRAQMKKLGTTNNPPQPLGIGSQEASDASNLTTANDSRQRPVSRSSGPLTFSSHATDPSSSQHAPLRTTSARRTLPHRDYNQAHADTATASALSRNPSTTTVTQSKLATPSSPHQTPTRRSFRTSFGSQHRRPRPSMSDLGGDSSSSPPPGSPLSSHDTSSDDDDDDNHHKPSRSVARSQAFRRPPDLRTISSGDDGEDEQDDEYASSGGFLPFAPEVVSDEPDVTTRALSSGSSLSAQQAGPSMRTNTVQAGRKEYDQRQQSQDTARSDRTGTGTETKTRPRAALPRETKQYPTSSKPSSSSSPADVLSPRRRAELARLSPRARREGSDGTPSMGSSFSDLDGECQSPFIVSA